MEINRILRTITTSLLFFFSVTVAQAQTMGSVNGSITDASGGALIGVTVTAYGAGTFAKSEQTSPEGFYQIEGLPSGSYRVEAELSGFATAVQQVSIAAGQSQKIDMRLDLAKLEEDVTVSSEAIISTDPQSNASALVLKGEDLEALPDDPDELAEALQALSGPAAGPSGGQLFIDGFSSGRLPPKASIREIRINTNPFSAEFDRPGHGRIEVLTKAGTDQFRGQAGFSFNDEVLNSRNPYASNRPPFQRRDWSGDIAGPLIRGKASFALDVGRRDIEDNDIVNATVLDLSLRPTPFQQAFVGTSRRTNVSPRIDYQINPSHTVIARYSYESSLRENSGVGDFSLPTRGYDTEDSEHSVQLTHTAVLNQKVVNEIRVEYSEDRREQRPDNALPTVRVLDAFTGGGSQIGESSNREKSWELMNLTLWTWGKHSLRGGARLRMLDIVDISRQNFGGTVTFSGGVGPVLDANDAVVLNANGQPLLDTITTIEQYRRTILFQSLGFSPAEVRALGGGATQFSLSGGNPEASVSQSDLSFFVQDDWRVRQGLTVSWGARAETQNNIRRRWDFAPRLGFAWTPGSGEKKSQTVIRGGFGIFYDRVSEGLTLDALRFDGERQLQYIVTDPNILGLIPVRVDGVGPLPSVATLGAFAVPQVRRRLDPDLRTPVTYQAAFSVERSFPKNFVVSANAIGARMRHLQRTRNINAPLAGPGSARPLGDVGNIYQYESTGRLNQTQLIFSVTNRLSRQFSFFTRYYLNWANSDVDGAGFPADPYDLSQEWSRASIDVRHRFLLGGQMTMPGGIRISPFVIASSGRPYNITLGRDLNGDTVFTERPSFATDLTKPSVIMTPLGAFDTNPAPGEISIPRNYGRGPRFMTVSLRLSKTISLSKSAPETTSEGDQRGGGFGRLAGTPGGGSSGGSSGSGRRGGESLEGRKQLIFSLGIQNLLNRTNAGTPIGNLSSALFGQSNSAASSFGSGGSAAGNRRIELQVRVGF